MGDWRAGFIVTAVLLILIGALIFGLGHWVFGGDGSIRSRERIVPTYELVVEDNVVDTVWVYSPAR